MVAMVRASWTGTRPLPSHLSGLPAGRSSRPGGRSAERLHRRAQARVNLEMERFVNGPLDRLLRFATAQPGIVITAAAGVLILCVALIPAGIVGVAFTPTVEGNLVTATLEMPEGTPQARTASVAQELENAGRRAVDRLSADSSEEAEPLLTGVAITLGGAPTTLGSSIVDPGGAPESGPRTHLATVQFRLLEAQRRTIASATVRPAFSISVSPGVPERAAAASAAYISATEIRARSPPSLMRERCGTGRPASVARRRSRPPPCGRPRRDASRSRCAPHPRHSCCS